MRVSRSAALLVALMLPLTACGNDDAEASQAISDSIMESQEEQAGGAAQMFSMSREEADCIGEGFVDRIGVDQLQEYGFLTDDLETAADLANVEMSEDDAAAAADTVIECANVQEMLTKALGDIDAETRECFEEVLTDDALRQLFTKMFSGMQDEAAQELVRPMMECAAPDLQTQ